MFRGYIDLLLYAAMPYINKKEVEIYETADISEPLSSAANKRISRRLKYEKNNLTRHENYHPVYAILKRVAIITLVILSVGFTCVISVEAVREAIWNTVIEWYENSIFFSYTRDGNNVVPNEILEYKEPQLDANYNRYEGRKSKYDFVVEYEKNDTLIMYEQSLLYEYEILLSNNDTIMEPIEIDGYAGYSIVFETQGERSTTIIWNDYVYTYKLVSNLTLNELLLIAETIG